MFCEGRRIPDPRREGGRIGIFRGLDNAHDRELFPVLYKLAHICFVVCFVFPHLILAVIFIIIRAVYKAECDPQDILIGVISHVSRSLHVFFIDKLPNHLIQLHGVTQSHRIKHEVADTAARGEHKHTLIITFRPAPCFHIVLSFIKLCIFRHLIKHVRAHHGGHHTVRTGRGPEPESIKGFVRVHLAHAVPVYPVNLRNHIVGIFYCVCVFLDPALPAFQIFLQRLQVIGIHC